MTRSWAAEFSPSGVRINTVASSRASHITGATIAADGGRTAV
jgi:hypothetical protein